MAETTRSLSATMAALALSCAAHAVVLPVSSRPGIGATPYTAGTAKEIGRAHV